MLRVVLDTNVLVSAVLESRGIPAKLVASWRGREWTLCLSERILAEVVEVLALPRIRRKYPLPEEDIRDFETLLRTDAESVETVAIPPVIVAHPADDAILACALAAKADFIVSGDRHLTGLCQYREMPILTPRQFLERMTPSSSRQ